MTPKALLLQQLVDLQNRITELSRNSKGQLGELTRGEVALLSFALGCFTGELLQELHPKAPRRKRRAAKKAQAGT
jgi:hypothetical protein